MGTGEVSKRAALAVRRSVEHGQSGDEQCFGKARVRLVSALNSNVASCGAMALIGRASALKSKVEEWQSIGMDMYSLGIARH